MTVDLVNAEQNALVALDGASDALARLAQWVEAAGNAHRLVAPLVGTAFVPDTYKPKIDPRATPEQWAEARQTAIANATAAVLQGITLGLDPMTALQQIYVVHGRPGMYAKIKVALVLSKGHEVWTEDLSDSRAVVAGRRKGTQTIERVVITMEQARKAGWTRNDMYAKTPQDMLWARAAGRVCDRIAADALMGIASVEEIQDELAPATATRTVGTGRTIQRATPPKAVGARKPSDAAKSEGDAGAPVPATPPEPPLPGDEAYESPPNKGSAGHVGAEPVREPPGEPPASGSPPGPHGNGNAGSSGGGVDAEPASVGRPNERDLATEGPAQHGPNLDPRLTVTPAQLQKLNILMIEELGIDDRKHRLRILSGLANREVSSSKELTVGEASTVIDTLERLKGEPDPYGAVVELLAAVAETTKAPPDG